MNSRPRAKKSLGQNFLVDAHQQRRIVAALEPEPTDTVLEIGPGQGALTRHLAGHVARLILVELDDALAAALALEFAGRHDVQVLHADFMTLDLGDVVRDMHNVKVVGNVPYNITTPIIFRLLERRCRPRSMVLMIQREVADRITAEPGTADYGALSVGVRSVARVERLFHVGRGAFRPVPRVDSTVIRITPLTPPPITERQENDLRELTRTTFSWRRKQLQKTLRSSPGYMLGPRDLEAVTAATGIDLQQRPEQLSPGQFLTLADSLRDVLGSRAASDQHEQHMHEVYPVLAHELRSPISAILGYEELLADDALGSLDPRAREALQRIRTAALQLSDLADGIERLGHDAAATEPVAPAESDDLIAHALDALTLEAQARDISLAAAGQNVTLHTRHLEARRAIVLALGAAIKVSHGASLTLSAASGATPGIRIAGTRLDVDVDSPDAVDPHSERRLTGAGLRLAFAAAAARLAGGSITLEPAQSGTDVCIELPPAVD